MGPPGSQLAQVLKAEQVILNLLQTALGIPSMSAHLGVTGSSEALSLAPEPFLTQSIISDVAI
jgi:hypothetical protein